MIRLRSQVWGKNITEIKYLLIAPSQEVHTHTSLDTLTLITWLRCVQQVPPPKAHSFPPSIVYSFAARHQVQPTFKGEWSIFIMLCPRTDFSIRNRDQFFQKSIIRKPGPWALVSAVWPGRHHCCFKWFARPPLCKMGGVALPSPEGGWGITGARHVKGVAAATLHPMAMEVKLLPSSLRSPAPANTQHLPTSGLCYLCRKHPPPSLCSNITPLGKSSLTLLLKVTFSYTLSIPSPCWGVFLWLSARPAIIF